VPGGESRHNLAYWRYADYAGIGPGAHGRITLPASFLRKLEPRPTAPGNDAAERLIATRRHRAPEPWAERVERDGHGTVEQVPLEPLERAREMLLMGLRLTEGIDSVRFSSRTGVPLEAALDPSVLRQAIDEGYLASRGTSLAATSAGRLRLDALLTAIVR
jgi:coproporphyrinogen III oxidase-like Fe-S oxidoreductase